MIATIQVLVLLLAVVATIAVIANRLRIPPSILLVLTGVLLALVPGLPPVELAPDLVLLLVLPPIIYSSAFLMSWREFQFNLRPITLLAVGGVLFTTIAVAAAAHWVMDLPWPIGFLFRHGKLQDESRRRIERELDLREAHLSNQRSKT
jgi:CPA1 family monovalent cation:H+ antiporter